MTLKVLDLLNEDLASRILDVREVRGKNYYKLYLIVDEDTYTMLSDLVDISDSSVDEVFEKAIEEFYKKHISFSSQDRESVEGKLDVKRDLSELKDMLKRLERRIKEAISDVLSSTQTKVTVTAPQPISGKRSSDIEVEMPELEIVESPVEKERASLEDALAKAIVVAIDDELQSTLGIKTENKEDVD